jgi:hypothetical protein
MRFFWLGLTGLVLLVLAAMSALEPGMIPWSVIGGGALAWAVAFGICYWDASAWRRRLPFVLDGYDWIQGEDPTANDERRAPWVAIQVSITLKQASAEAARERTHILELLAARVNTTLTEDRDAPPGEARLWELAASGASAAGEATRGIYATRELERWLRHEVRTLADAHPIERVTVHARYTGASYMLPSD